MAQHVGKAAGGRDAVVQLSGLTCPSCVARIEGAVRRLDGVRRAELHFASQRLALELEPGRISAEQVSERVRELGYRVVSAREAGMDSR